MQTVYRYLVLAVLLIVALGFVPNGGIAFALPLAACLCAYLIIRSGWRYRAWRWAAVASVFWALEEVTWTALRLADMRSFYLSSFNLSDSFYFAGSAAWIIALLSMDKRVLPRLNMLLALPVWGLVLTLLWQSLNKSFSLFLVTDVILLFCALPLVESALKSHAHEGRILFGFGFYVKALASTLYGWLVAESAIEPSYFMLTLLAYCFMGVGAWLELQKARGTLIPAIFSVIGVEAVLGIVLFMLFQARATNVSSFLFATIASILAYLLFFGVMILILTDRASRRKAETSLKNYSSLLEKLLTMRPDKYALEDLLSSLVAHLKPTFTNLNGLELLSTPRALYGTAEGYAFPLVADGTKLGHLYFDTQPKESDLLDALAPLVANQLQNKLSHLSSQNEAMTDPLTGLLNRRGLSLQSKVLVENAKAQKLHLSLAILDLDHFKRVNDSFGHEVGDTALVVLANILKRSLRQEDLAVRWGGEEFLLLLFDSTICTAQDISKRICQELKSSQIPLIPWALTVSVGLTGGYVLEDGFDLTAWINQADHALLSAKTLGRDRVEVAA